MNNLITTSVTLGHAALLAGIAILTMIVVAPYSYGFVYGELVTHGEPLATLTRIRDQQLLFRSSFIGFLTVMLADIVAAYAHYLFLSPVE